MNYDSLEKFLFEKAEKNIDNHDPSHDIQHCMRVLRNCEKIAAKEWWDMEILLPAALFHDIINYPKDDPRAQYASNESSVWTMKLLEKIQTYPTSKIQKVWYAIAYCSYSKDLPHESIESKILQDADFLESVWAIAIMRTFCTSWTLWRPFFADDDLFCENRQPEPFKYSFDLFSQRLLKVQDRMLTTTWKELAQQRTEFLHTFIAQVKKEIQ